MRVGVKGLKFRPSSAAEKVSIVCGTNNHVKSEMLSNRHTHRPSTVQSSKFKFKVSFALTQRVSHTCIIKIIQYHQKQFIKVEPGNKSPFLPSAGLRSSVRGFYIAAGRSVQRALDGHSAGCRSL